MSLWGATVITNFFSAIPVIGKDLVEYIWGNYSVDNSTLNRFFSLHYLLPFVLVGLVMLHFIALHTHGSNNPLGISGNVDRIYFHPYYIFKDIVGFLIFFVLLAIMIFYAPNLLGHSDNYIPGNSLVTPTHIVPEWYYLFAYCILRSIPSKIGGVIAMFSSIAILLLLPYLDTSRVRGSAFRPLARVGFWLFVANFIMLMYLGGKPVEAPFEGLGQISTGLYFSYFIIVVPLIGLIENKLSEC